VDGIEFRTLRSSEREPLLDLLQAAFDERELFARYLDADGLLGPDDTWVALDGSRLVTSVQVFEKSIRLHGQVATIGGIGSVATHPDYERRGIASELLRRVIGGMKERGHALSLLFATRIPFYERLGWVQLPHPTWTLTRTAPARELDSRPFVASDLDRIERIYDYYNLHANASAVRDRRYWLAQLAYAGTPDEDFRVVERDGKIVAYARQIDFYGIPRIMEHGCAPDGRPELARLLSGFAPASGALVVHRTDDAALAEALQDTGVDVRETEWGDTLWRVIDRDRVLDLAKLPSQTSDTELLHKLVGNESAVFWTSDRF
jgi:predicted N-acetyltransferase YhbS